MELCLFAEISELTQLLRLKTSRTSLKYFKNLQSFKKNIEMKDLEHLKLEYPVGYQYYSCKRCLL